MVTYAEYTYIFVTALSQGNILVIVHCFNFLGFFHKNQTFKIFEHIKDISILFLDLPLNMGTSEFKTVVASFEWYLTFIYFAQFYEILKWLLYSLYFCRNFKIQIFFKIITLNWKATYETTASGFMAFDTWYSSEIFGVKRCLFEKLILVWL